MSLGIVISWIVNNTGNHSINTLCDLFLDITITAQILLLIVSMYLIRQQLLERIIHTSDFRFYDDQLVNALKFLAFTLFFEGVGFMIWYKVAIQGDDTVWLIIDLSTQIWISCCLCVFMTSTLYFVVVDAKICTDQVEYLITLTHNDTLTLGEYKRVKGEIEQRIAKTTTINTMRVVVAMLYLFVILVFIFVIRGHYAFEVSLFCMAASVKELTFVTVIFFQVNTLMWRCLVLFCDVIYF
jgi:hypothetical protein